MIVRWRYNRADRWGWGLSLAIWFGVALAWWWLEISG